MRNLKRVLSLGLALVMMLSLMIVSAGAVSTYEDFTDKDEIQNTEAVNTMVSLGVIDGKDDGSYDPTGIVTRAEMAKLIAVTMNGGTDPLLGSNASTTQFTDTKGHWAEAYIAWCSNLGVINGRGDGTFGPDATVTGTEAAKMMLTALGYRSDIEGLTGAEWNTNTEILANRVGLFDGITTDPDNGMTRDDTAQLIYNGVQAQEVVYRNNYGEYSGVIYATDNGTVLENRFHVSKVTGILEANDKVSVAGAIRDGSTLVGHEAGAVALEGESLLCVTDVSGYTRDDFGRLYDAATYKVDTPDEMVGQEIVIYVKYLNDLSPNAASATVIGEPILTENNTVVETTTRLKDDAAVRSALRAGGLTNIGTEAAAFLYTEVDVQTGVATGITDTITSQIRTNLSNAEATRSAGILQRFIDNDGNGYPDYIIQVAPVLSAVNSVNTAGDKFTFTGISGTIDADDIVTDEDLARNDVILINKYADDCYYISYPDTVEGTIASYNTNNNTVSVDGTSYGNSGGKNLAVTTGQEQILTEEMVDGSYIFYLDPYGNVLGALETEGVVGNYAVVQGWNRTGNSTMGYSVTVKLLMQDGTTANYDVNLAATAVRLGVAAATDSTRTKEDKITVDDTYDGVTINGSDFFGDPDTAGDGVNVLDHLFSYTLDGDTVTLAYPQEVNDDRYMSSNWDGTLDQDDSLTSGITVRNNTATYTLTNGESIVANDQTVFFIKDDQGDYFVVTGLANLPSNTTNTTSLDTVGIPVNTTVSDTISYQAPGSSTWIARAVFLKTTNTFESVRDFVFVTDKYVTQNVSGSPVYTFTVVNAEGEESQMTTTSPNANALKNTVREWNYDGSYVEFHPGDGSFTHHNVFISEIDGNVITLSNVDTGAVIASYRVDGGADIWDVQDEPVADTLQVNDIVGVYLDDESIVTAAFIYDVMDGAYADLPSSITLGGVALGSGATAVSATASQALPLVVTVPADVTLSSIELGGTAVTMTKSGNTYTGTYTAPASGTVSLSVAIVVSQPGRDTYTYTYGGTFEVTVSGAPAGSGNIDAATGSDQVIANVDDDTKVISLKNATDGNTSLTLSFLLNQALSGAEGVYTQSLGMYAEVPSASMNTQVTNANVGTYFFKSGDVYYSLAFAKADAIAIAEGTAAQATDGQTFVYTLTAAPDVNAVSNTTVKVYDAATGSSEITTSSVAYASGELTITLATALDASNPTDELYVEVQGAGGNSDRVKLVANFEPAALAGSGLASATTADGSTANVTIDSYNSGTYTGFSLKVYTDADATQPAEGVTATFSSDTQVDFAGLSIEASSSATYYVTVVVDANNTVESAPATVTISRT